MQNEGLSVRKGASTEKDPRRAARALFDAVYAPDAALTIFFCSPDYDLEALGRELREAFGDAHVDIPQKNIPLTTELTE